MKFLCIFPSCWLPASFKKYCLVKNKSLWDYYFLTFLNKEKRKTHSPSASVQVSTFVQSLTQKHCLVEQLWLSSMQDVHYLSDSALASARIWSNLRCFFSMLLTLERWLSRAMVRSSTWKAPRKSLQLQSTVYGSPDCAGVYTCMLKRLNPSPCVSESNELPPQTKYSICTHSLEKKKKKALSSWQKNTQSNNQNWCVQAIYSI